MVVVHRDCTAAWEGFELAPVNAYREPRKVLQQGRAQSVHGGGTRGE